MTISCHAASENAKSSWALTLENDVIAQSDNNYTNGVQYSWAKETYIETRLQKWLHQSACAYRSCQVTGPNVVTTRIGQIMYTPEDISIASPQPQRRPWAAMLYAHRTYTVPVSEAEEITFGALTGVTGPPALAEPTQKFIHEYVVRSTDPKGWHNQIGTSLGAMATIEWRRAIGEVNNNSGWGAQGTWYWRGAIGNVMTYGAVGATVFFGRYLPALVKIDAIQNKRMSDYLSAPTTVSPERLDLTLFAGVEARAMAYNVFLDGRLGHSDPHVDSKLFVGDASLGMKLAFPRLYGGSHGSPYLMIKAVRRSPEYRSIRPAGFQTWGELTIGSDFF